MAKKPKNVFFKFIFSRTMVTIFLILVQMDLLFGIFIGLGRYSTVVMALLNVLGTICLVYLINKDDITEFKLAWAIPICVLPVFGTLLFLFVDRNFGSRQSKKHLRKRLVETAEYLRTDEHTKEVLQQYPKRVQALPYYMEHTGGYPTFTDCAASYFENGGKMWEDLLQELSRAEDFIFLEYFIIERGEMWDSILEILKEKAAKGVEVRVMYDGMCSILLLPYKYPKVLESYGIKARMFAPILPLLSTHQNNRDHRKILVVDGKVAYTGGVNLADEYVGKKIRFGDWKDTGVKVSGTAVNSFTLMFLQMWNATREAGQEDYARYLWKTPLSVTEKEESRQGLVMPYADGPHQKENVAERVYMDILNTAQRYVHIMTPYFIVDEKMMEALEYAALRGVDVKLILPHIPDKKIAFAIARNQYPTLLKAGIKVYEYEPGFVHAKSFVSDDCKAVVGSINMDYRSLYHHFECAAYFYDHPVTACVEKDFQQTLLSCRQVDMEYYKSIPAGSRLIGYIVNLFGPLM